MNQDKDKYAILNVSKIIDMVEEARIAMYSDTEQTAFILEELVSILNGVSALDDINKQLGKSLEQ